MLTVETIRKIRLATRDGKKSIRQTAKDFNVSRNTVRKILRSDQTRFEYHRESVHRPKLGPFVDTLTMLLKDDQPLPFRQGHKTDSNDALAVAEAARRPSIKEAPMKTVEQQGLQAIHRSRQLLIQESTALSNHLRGLLMEFGVVIPQGFASLLRAVPEVLEDGENELPDMYRPTLHRMYTRLLELREHIETMTSEVEVLVKQHPICSRLTALEGIGPIGALLLYATLGSGNAFNGSREFAAYLGLAPRQYSSGGKTNIVGLSKKIGNSRLRSILILGARAYTYRLKEPKSSKDRWLKDVIERNGHSRAAIALANKNVRTAWAMVTQGTEYQRRGQLKVAA